MASREVIRTAVLSLIIERRGACTFQTIWHHVSLRLNLCGEDGIHEALNDLVAGGDLMVVKTWKLDPVRDFHRPKP